MPIQDGGKKTTSSTGSGNGSNTIKKNSCMTAPVPTPSNTLVPTPSGIRPAASVTPPVPGTTKLGSAQSKKAQAILMTPAKMQELNDSIATLGYFVNHGYLADLGTCDTLAARFGSYEGIELFKITRMMYGGGEDFYEKLVSLYAAMYHKKGSIALIVHSEGNDVQLYIGVIINDGKSSASQFKQLFTSSFPGTVVKQIDENEKYDLLDKIGKKPASGSVRNKHVASVSVVPSRRKQEAENKQVTVSAQSIDKFIDSMQGKTYTAIILAHPIEAQVIDQCRRGFESMFTMLSPFSKEQVTYGENESDATNFSLSSSLSQSVSSSVARSYSRSHGTSTSKGKGGSKGSGTSGESWLGGGYSFNSGSCWNSGKSVSDTTTNGDSETESTSTSDTNGETEGDSHTKGRNISINLTREIKPVQEAMACLNEEIKRMKASRVFGMWDCAAYIVSENDAAVGMAASNLAALLSGDEAYGGTGYINYWNYFAEEENTGRILDAISHMIHPEFINKISGAGTPLTAALMVNGRDLPVMLSMPMRSVKGTEVLSTAAFGRNFPDSFVPSVPIRFGNVIHMGAEEPTSILFDLNRFSSHCFICGAAGSGKSNTTYQLLKEFYNHKVKFMVVEPAKGEYKTEFASMPDMTVFTCVRDKFRMLYLNPFEFNEKLTNIKEHMDRINGIFQTCWPMFGPLPAMIKESIEEAYISCGWDLKRSKRIRNIGSYYPTFSDMLDGFERIMERSAYSAQSKSDYRGALGMRIRLLMTGFEETIFGQAKGVSDEELFEHNVIVDLSALGNAETRSLIMGLLITRLREYRMNGQTVNNADLQHVMVLEEAHNILKRCDTSQHSDSSNVQGAAVSLLTDSIAEMRSSGEGFLIIDQSPTAVDEAAIKNTAIKIVMRLAEENDCRAAGTALSLTEEQTRELSKLNIGVAAIFHAGWSETVLGKMGEVWKKNPIAKAWSAQPPENDYFDLLHARSALGQWVAAQRKEGNLEKLTKYNMINYISWLQKSPRITLNDNAWSDIRSEISQFIDVAREFLADYKGTSKQKLQLDRMLGKFFRSFFQIDDLLRICPLNIRGFSKNATDGTYILKKDQKKDVLHWWGDVCDCLEEYMLYPLTYDGDIPEARRPVINFTNDAEKAQYLIATMCYILASYDIDYRKKYGGDLRYMQAWIIITDKYSEND